MAITNPGSAGTAIVNGQLTSQAPGVSFTPLGYVPYAAQGAARPPSLPPSTGGYGSSGASVYGEPSTYASANDNSAMVANAQASPFSIGASPVIPAIVMLAIALFLLHFVHFRTVVEAHG